MHGREAHSASLAGWKPPEGLMLVGRPRVSDAWFSSSFELVFHSIQSLFHFLQMVPKELHEWHVLNPNTHRHQFPPPRSRRDYEIIPNEKKIINK